MKRLLLLLALPCLALPVVADEPGPKISVARDDNGILTHTVESPYQDKSTTIRVLLPTRMEKNRAYPVLYILPVEAGNGNRYGDGLLEVKKLNLHDKHGLICVMPTFARLPWYADHPMDGKIAQETHFLKVVLPFVEKTYPVQKKARGRLLLGFSKSGWGAFSLLLRYLGIFGMAAAWDAPLMMDAPGKYGSGEIFGTPENFQKYRLTKLLEAKASDMGEGKRLIVLGYGNFRKEHQAAHDLLGRLKIEHEYRDGPARKHDWHSGWVKDAVESLVANNRVPEK